MKTLHSTIKTLSIAVAFLGLLLTSNFVKAAPNTGKEVELVFLGNEATLPVFRLDFGGDAKDVFLITIKANDGTILYSEKVKKDYSSRFYKLNPEDNGQVKGTSFEILNMNSGKTILYKIDSKTQTTETVSLVKL